MGGALNLHSAIIPRDVHERKVDLQFTYKAITSASLAKMAIKFQVL